MLGLLACVVVLTSCQKQSQAEEDADQLKQQKKTMVKSSVQVPKVAENKTYLGNGWWTFTIQDTCFLFGTGKYSRDQRSVTGSLTEVSDIQFCYNQTPAIKEKTSEPSTY